LGGLPRFAPAQTTLPPCLAPGLALGLALCLTFGATSAAHAQLSGALGVQSDYRFRGISLTDRQPVATLDLAYDHPSGLYAGGSAIVMDDEGPRAVGFIEYAGFATPRIGRVSLDFGVDNQNLAEYADKRYPLNYSELYVGVAGSHLSAHVYFSPNYFRRGVQTLYADVEGTMKPWADWRLFGHLGTTAPMGNIAGRRQRYDLRAGVARQFGPLELQASVTATSPAPPAPSPPEPVALVVGASWFF
jgi:uncharacterized protein (TIGR02001 family)